MDGHDSLLEAFLAGGLDPANARSFDEHLLDCEACWKAVRANRAGRLAAQVLRQPAPPGLTDRVAFAVEVAASARQQGLAAGAAGRLRWRLAGGGAVVAGVLATLLVMLSGGRG